MLTTFFITINNWITGAPALAALGCFLWGMVSVLLSPCHLASIPLVMAYVAGQKQVMKPRQAAHYAIFYTAGMFITIAARWIRARAWLRYFTRLTVIPSQPGWRG